MLGSRLGYVSAAVVLLVSLLVLPISVASANTTGDDGLPVSVTPQAPPSVQSAFARLLGFLMFVAWGVVIGAVIFSAILHILGKEAPQFLGRVIVAVFILAFGLTIIWWIVH